MSESNLQHGGFQGGALTTVLSEHGAERKGDEKERKKNIQYTKDIKGR